MLLLPHLRLSASTFNPKPHSTVMNIWNWLHRRFVTYYYWCFLALRTWRRHAHSLKWSGSAQQSSLPFMFTWVRVCARAQSRASTIRAAMIIRDLNAQSKSSIYCSSNWFEATKLQNAFSKLEICGCSNEDGECVILESKAETMDKDAEPMKPQRTKMEMNWMK